jgi:RNA polymerase sigma factor (sigma-70 family)
MNDADPRSTRPSLLLRIRDPGDAASWQSFAEIYGPLIRSYCRGRGLQEADASDVGQEVLTQVARSIRSFEYQPDRGRFRDWLGTVTRNKIARFVATRDRGDRAAGGEEPAGHFEAIESPEADNEWTSAFHDRILQVALARVRHDFEPTTWDAFERIWLDDRPSAETAAALGLTIDAVYAAKSRVLKRLREEVVALAEDLPLHRLRG